MTTERKNWRGLLTDCGGLAFAIVWAARGAHAGRLPISLTVALIAIPTLLLLLGFIRRDLVLRRPEISLDPKLTRRIKILRFAGIFAAVSWTQAHHRVDLFYPMLGAIIGLSYIPLGRAMKEPIHIGMGAAIIVISGLSLLLPEPGHLEVAGFGTALAIWVGSMLRLHRSSLSPGVEPSPATLS
ncbi:hypothetical protein [Gluconobacter kanchanaburiensis]|uniref:Uncharacterized protein n=1 Tax=Gluconobacter kanchanaburiensis NBRC 103587 TaxID=1307948 RepID=A0A511BAZ4_9PROT|nr:hypothetical protein [Gluconobacter kanchanaburiensis]MBF0862668.1 hypothetical protein [Gluconobacter kanchanaburiensis]GBR67524.1 hypothetical protein AA103587_0327 [Gluconobacter kanchanaburiensis NBRC 103587]GEK96961.1 hypothetical protein GKA01_21580 [Gluconobacter kanchanaburiensis NBRC 103587]